MAISQALQLIVYLALGLPFVIFGLYGAVLLYYSKRGGGEQPDKSEIRTDKPEPFVSIIVPTHNEEAIISKRIENLLELSYPQDKMEVIFVDDSSDSTPAVIHAYSQKFPFIRLIKFHERMGYSPCLIAGCGAAEGEIVIFAEAGSLLDSQAIRYLVSNFRNPDVGIVSGKDVILNADEDVGKSEDLYLKILSFIRGAESNMDSTIYMKGEAAAVRKKLIEDLRDLGKCPGTADTAIALFVRKKGFRFIYDPRVKFYEYAPSTRRGRIRQKVIRGANLIKVLWEFRGMFFKRKYGKFGVIILPFSFAMLTLVPVSFLAGAFSLILLTLSEPTLSYMIWVVIAAFFFLIFLYSRQIVFTFLEFEYSLLKALYEIVFVKRTHDKIDKVASTRR